jgi:hypothetical protein
MMRINTSLRVIRSLAFVALGAIGAADAKAGFTSFNTSKHATEMTHAQILGQTYGGSFASSGGVDLTNGAVTATRLDDASDQCWTEGPFSARAIARFAGSDQIFGVVRGDSGGSFEQIFDVTGWGTNVSGSASHIDLSGQTFRFARAGHGDATFTSSDADNFFGADQMVSYHLSGPNGLSRYVLFFEDVGANLDSDWDFNDMVVEITPHAVPLPPAAWTGLAVLFARGAWNARKRMRAMVK